jgi:hypothetical protein
MIESGKYMFWLNEEILCVLDVDRLPNVGESINIDGVDYTVATRPTLFLDNKLGIPWVGLKRAMMKESGGMIQLRGIYDPFPGTGLKIGQKETMRFYIDDHRYYETQAVKTKETKGGKETFKILGRVILKVDKRWSKAKISWYQDTINIPK